MRYCPYCKKQVPNKLTTGQIVVMLILYITYIIPGVLYSCFHARKCSICGARTTKTKKDIYKF